MYTIKVTCPVCGKKVATAKDGSIRLHGRYWDADAMVMRSCTGTYAKALSE